MEKYPGEKAKELSIGQKFNLVRSYVAVEEMASSPDSLKTYDAYTNFYGEKFPEHYGKEVIERDKNILLDREGIFNREASKYHTPEQIGSGSPIPKAAEHLLRHMSDVIFTEEALNGSPESILSHRADDVLRGVDIMKTVGGTPRNPDSITFGLDATISSSATSINDKIMIHKGDYAAKRNQSGKLKNDKTAYPYGFVRPKFYQYIDPESDKRVAYPIARRPMPRFTVGISDTSVIDLVCGLADDKNHLSNTKSPDVAITRFKMLHEMQVQQEMYQKRLTEASGRVFKEEDCAKFQLRLNKMGDYITDALDECVEQFMPTKVENKAFGDTYMDPKIPIFQKDIQEKMNGLSRDEAISFISEQLCNNRSSLYDGTYRQILESTAIAANGEAMEKTWRLTDIYGFYNSDKPAEGISKRKNITMVYNSKNSSLNDRDPRNPKRKRA